jgi:glycosyltransferase involved in cell wall biosynthesis
MTPIPVAYVMPRLSLAGTERHILEVLTHLDRRVFTPMLCCLRAEGDYLLNRVRELGVPVVDSHVGPSLRGPELPRAVVRLSRELRQWGASVVHSYLFHGNLLGTLAARLAGVPVALASKRSLDTYPKRQDRWACHVVNHLADCVTANAEAVRRHVHTAEGCRLDKIVVIPNGVDLTRFRGTHSPTPGPPAEFPRSGPILGSVARLAPKKGQATLIEAAALVLRRRPDATFVLVGGGPQRAELRAHADRLGLDGRLRFLGPVEDPVPLLSRMDIFVLPSHMEGMSNALLEAMAAGRPVVATDVGGNAEVVRDGVTGLLVPPRDAGRLAEALLALLDDPARAGAMGAAGRVRVEAHFSAGVMVRHLEDLYRKLLVRKGALGG